MTFQPFGYRFELKSPMPVVAVKAAIRAKKKHWYEPKTGARGWIAGPVLCLWSGALDPHGPMVIAAIRQDRSGTRIVGRAGSDLNGTIALVFLTTAAMVWLTYEILEESQPTPPLFVMFGLIFGLVPLAVWMSHKNRRQAEPLVRFLRRVIGIATTEPARPTFASETLATITVNDTPIKADALYDALIDLSTGDYAIIEFDEHVYMQVLATDDAFIVEKREGGADRHFVAQLAKGRLGEGACYDTAVRQLIALMADYSQGRPPRHNPQWKRIQI